jgi:hypothetical protein
MPQAPAPDDGEKFRVTRFSTRPTINDRLVEIVFATVAVTATGGWMAALVWLSGRIFGLW